MYATSRVAPFPGTAVPSTNVEPTHLSQPRSCPAGTSACFALPGMRHPAGSRAVFHSAAVLPKAPFTSAVTQNYRQKRALQAPLHHCCAWKRKRMRTGAAAQSGAAVVEQQPDKGPLLSPLRQWRDWWNLKASDQVASESQPQPLRSIVLKLWRLMRVNRGLLAAAFGCMVVSALSELSIPHYTSACIFAAAEKKSGEAFSGFLRLLVAVSLSYGLFAGLRGFCFSLLNTMLIQNLRAELFRSIIAREVAFFDSAEVGVLTSRLGSDCQSVVRCLSTNINVAARNSMQCIGGAIYLTWLSRELALACLVMTMLLWTVALRHGSFSRKAQRAYMNKLADTNQVAQEVFLLSRVVRTFGTEERETGRYRRQLSTLRRISVRQATAYLLYLATNGSLFHLTKVMALGMGGSMALAGRISGQQLTAFVLYVEFVMAASLSVCDQWGGVMEAIGASERVIDYLDAPPAPQLAPGRVLPAFTGKVQLRNVSYSYPTRPAEPALRGVSLTLEPGKLLALVGLSGSGKSTLVAMLQRLYDPTEGQVLVDGVDLREIDSAWFRSQIGVVDQDPRLFAETIRSNIAYSMEDTPEDRVEEAARLANADKFINSLPKGFDTQVTDKLLSGGQRQRIALARALVRQPKLLVLDEATSALDAESEASVAKALDTAMRTSGRSVLVIAHRLSTVRNADHIIVMQKGQIEEEGTHEDLVLGGGIYSRLVSRQQGNDNPSKPQRTTLTSTPDTFDEEDTGHASRLRFDEEDDEEGNSIIVTLSRGAGGNGASIDDDTEEDRTGTEGREKQEAVQ